MKHMFIPDVQAKPGVDPAYLGWIGKYAAYKRPDVIVCIGDFADMPSLSSYDKGKRGFEGKRYNLDVEATHKAMDTLMAPLWAVRKSYKPRLVLTLGNHEHRIERVIEEDPKLSGTLSISQLGYEEYGWEVHPFLEVVTINGVNYSHYFPTGVKGNAASTARAVLAKNHSSCIAGHLQGRDVAYGKRADGTEITCIIAGSCYLHNETYLSPQTNKHWRGLYMLHDVKNGSFDEMPVSLNYLKNKYGKK